MEGRIKISVLTQNVTECIINYVPISATGSFIVRSVISVLRLRIVFELK